MFGGLKISEVKQISSISKKLKLDRSKLALLSQAKNSGKSEDEVMMELFQIPEGQSSTTYLKETLSEQEYEVLKKLFSNFTNGKGKNPLT